MDPKEKKVKEEEMNVEDILNNGAEEQPQNEQAEDAAPLTHEEELEQELGKAQELVGQYGMSGLAELLKQILDGVGMRRHRIAGKEEDRMGEIYTRVNEYLYLGMEKIAYDRGWGYYCKAGGEEAQT